MNRPKQSSEINFLLQLIDQGYEKKAWHGPNLRGSLRGISVKEALWRPRKGRHNIWEIAVHTAYWKYIVRRRLLGEKRGSFPLKGSNWFPRTEPLSEKDWHRDLLLLDTMHRKMRETIAGLQPANLQGIPSGSNVKIHSVISGIAAQDRKST